MFFGRKHVETEPSCLHELTTFLKFHMPLRGSSILMGLKIAFWESTAKKLLKLH